MRFAIIFAFLCAGCSNLPAIKDEGQCKVFQRPSYSRAISVQAPEIIVVGMIMEFPAPVFTDVTFRVAEDSTPLRKFISMQYTKWTTSQGCDAISNGEQLWSCNVVPSDLEGSGFYLNVVAPQSISADDAIRTTNEYWSSRLACHQLRRTE